MNKVFIRSKTSILKNPHSWILFIILIVLIYIYSYWPWRDLQFDLAGKSWLLWLSSLEDLTYFEFSNHIIGSVFLIPIFYATLVFNWKGAAIVTLLSILSLVPLLNDVWSTSVPWFTNIGIFLIPPIIALIIYAKLEIRHKEKEREKERQTYIAQIINGQEMERQLIAQELHDDTIQTILAIASNAEVLETSNDIDIALIQEKVGVIKNTLRNTVKDLRRMSLNLRPSVLDDMGLIPAIKWLLEQAEKENNMRTDVIIKGKEFKLSSQTEMSIFRIVQEAITNIKRHAKATNITVIFKYEDQSLEISIQDNGSGFFIPDKLSYFNHEGKMGIIGMQQRIMLINGTFNIFSKPEEGTSITIQIPLE